MICVRHQPAKHVSTCCWHVKEVPVGWTSVHPAVIGDDINDAAGTAAGAAAGVAAAGPGHLPQVVWQKLPASMKGALHLPNPFCRQHKQDR